jgi:hypothetical protein
MKIYEVQWNIATKTLKVIMKMHTHTQTHDWNLISPAIIRWSKLRILRKTEEIILIEEAEKYTYTT